MEKLGHPLKIKVNINKISQQTQASLRLLQDIVKRSRRLMIKPDILSTSQSKCQIYDVMKSPIKRRLCSNVLVISLQHQKKCFFFYLALSEIFRNVRCLCLGQYLDMKLCKLLTFFNHTFQKIYRIIGEEERKCSRSC